MNPLKNLNIAARIGVGYAALLLAAAALVAIALLALGRAGDAAQALLDHEWRKAEAAAVIDVRTRANARHTMELFFHAGGSPAAREARAGIASNRQAITEALATLDRLVTRTEGIELLHAVKAARVAYVRSFERVDALLAAGERDAARAALLDETLPRLDLLQLAVGKLSAFQTRLAHESAERLHGDLARQRMALLVLGLAIALGAVIGAWWTGRLIARPIEQAARVAERVADGQLGQPVATNEGGEPGRLVRALDRMDRNLVRIVGQVRHASDGVATGSAQIATGTDDLSQRTERQAANLQQTAASLEQVTAAARNSADAARSASAMALEASAAATEGGALMGAVGQTMDRISDASRRIGEINALIDGIAFQTNILALNAAVEAARAGDHGRGFAVVASEVRALAGRSAVAARDIKGLVAASAETVADGQARVHDAGRQIEAIVARTRQVSETIERISAAVAEQTIGIDQVNVAVAELDKATQQNAALVEESAAASQSLRDQARLLVDSVDAFRIGEPGRT